MIWDGSRIMGVAAAALGAATMIMAAGLSEGTATGGPGARFLPTLLGGLMVVLGVLVVIGRARPARGEAPSSPVTQEAGSSSRALATVGLMAAYALLLDRLGFLLTTAGLVAVLARLYGERRWTVAVGVAVAAAGAAYGLFAGWLRLPLPSGLVRF
jgi:putative tricarboxylic transport membrane protein